MMEKQIRSFPSREGYLFASPEGGPVRHRNFYRRFFRPAVKASGLAPDLRFHDLRHTCAAILISNGKHLEEVKDYLGHSSIRVTSDRYGHLFPRARVALRDSLESTFEQSIGDARAEAEIQAIGVSQS
jgi:integrase